MCLSKNYSNESPDPLFSKIMTIVPNTVQQVQFVQDLSRVNNLTSVEVDLDLQEDCDLVLGESFTT